MKHHDAASAWEARHGEPFAGHEYPFGALIHFRPVKPRREALPTFAPNGQPGVFFGYHLNPGCRYSGDVICAELSDFNKQAARVRIQRLREKSVFFPTDVVFPLKADYEAKFTGIHTDKSPGSMIAEGSPQPVEVDLSGEPLEDAAVDLLPSEDPATTVLFPNRQGKHANCQRPDDFYWKYGGSS